MTKAAQDYRSMIPNAVFIEPRSVQALAKPSREQWPTMTFVDAFQKGLPLVMRHALFPDMPPRQITKVVLDQKCVLVFDGQEDDPWDTRHPVLIEGPLQEGGPTWAHGNHIISVLE